MNVVDRRLELLEHILRLRRVGRALPGNDDVAEVRASLERELGETVSRRLAAQLLGVSHTALTRWIDSGDLPVVLSAAGRMQVPVPALLDLYESVTSDGDPGRYVLTPSIRSQREAADSLSLEDVRPVADPHDRARARALTYHRALARRLRRPMVDEARHVLFRWRRDGRIDPRYADRWEQVLSRSLPEIRRAISDDSPDADDLRQNSPLAGQLSEAERRRILAEVR